MAEILVPERVPVAYIQKIFVANEEVLDKVSEMGINNKKYPVKKTKGRHSKYNNL